MTDQEYVCLDDDEVVVNIVVLGDGNPTQLASAYGYARTIPTATYGKPVIGARLVDGMWQSPQPFPSWAWLDGEWVSPVPRPDEPGVSWDEDAQEWAYPAPDPRASAIAKLEALGLSPEEAVAIVGSV